MVSVPSLVTKGLTPALDRRQVTDTAILAGQNFLLDAEGPYSEFGSDFPTLAQLFDWTDAKIVTIEDQISTVLTNKAFLRLDKDSQRAYVTFAFPPTTVRFPWSTAQVGGKYYFVKKGVDVIKHDPLDDSWKILNSTNTPGMPQNPYALVASAGRLFIAAEEVISWSAIDNGELFEDIPAGAGSQSLAIINNGTPLGIHHTGIGVITYTTEGAMLSRRVDAPNPYRHRPFTEHFEPISPYCIVEIADGLHVFLDQTGLYQNNGNQVSPWQPLMGEYLHRTVLRDFDRTIENNPQIRLDFLRERNWFFISIAEPSQIDIYKNAYSIYLPRDEWGSFDHRHVFLDQFRFRTGIDLGFNFGYFDEFGFYNRFSGTNRNQVPLDITSNIIFQSSFQQPITDGLNEETVFGDVVEVTEYDRSVLTEPGLYDTSLDVVQPTFDTIDSFIDIGLWRLADQEVNDRFSRMTALTIGFSETVPLEAEDWLLQFTPDIFEDWNTLDGEEDWGFGISSGILFDALVIGTVDGKNVYEDNIQTPEIVLQSPEANYYTCDNVGIWHILRIDARKPEQGLHIKYLEPVLLPEGKI